MVASFNPTVRNVSKVWRLLSELETRYPSIEEWYFFTVLPGIESGKRDILIHVENSKVVGVCVLKIETSEISTLYIQKEFRNKGIGTKLLEKALEILDKQNQDISITFHRDVEDSLIRLLNKFRFSFYLQINDDIVYVRRNKRNAVLENIVKFLIEAGKLVNVKRKIQAIDSSEPESTAAHTYHMALTALVLLEDKVPAPNLLHIIKLILIHDLGEVYMGDFPFNNKPSNHIELEENSFKKLISFLPEEKRNHFLNLWWEYEAGSTQEALYAKAIDKLQPQLVTLSHIDKNVNYKPINSYTIEDCERLLWGYIRDMFPEFEFVIEKIKASMEK